LFKTETMATVLRLGVKRLGSDVARSNGVVSSSRAFSVTSGMEWGGKVKSALYNFGKKEEVLAKEMRDKFGLLSHKESLKDNTDVDSLTVDTHTVESWELTDHRNARFVDGNKLTVKKHAIDLIAEIPPIPSEDRIIACDGGGGALGHPKVFINLDHPGNHSCGYCGLRFFLDHHH